METITVSVSVLKELISISNDYLADPYASDTSKEYFRGKREAYQNLLDYFTN